MAFTRRHLPHWIPEETAVFVTWRVAGSLPHQSEIALPNDDTNPSSTPPRFLRQDERLDRERSGLVWLQNPRVVCVVENALLYGQAVRHFYELHAWVIMPNHVHVVFQPHTAMPTIMRWLKGRTSRVVNQILDRSGTPFWQDESFNHWVRSAEELQYLIEYVENNPVKAGLVEAKEQWRWSSAASVIDDKRRVYVHL